MSIQHHESNETAMNPINIDDIYDPKGDHRNGGNGYKSQWTISADDERTCFRNSYEKKWFINISGWGLHLSDELRPLKLGDTPTGEAVKLARFRRDIRKIKWHGYPANYRRCVQDRPPINILNEWQRTGYITKRDMRRVRGQQPCSLSN